MVDLGCGTGRLTRVAHDRLGMAQTVGLDRSESMLSKAAQHSGAGLSFEAADLRDASPSGRYDVVLSNAVLHWLSDQEAVIRRWVGALRPAGQLAFQVPANFHHPSHTAAWDVAAEPEFADALASTPPDADGEPGVLAPEQYAELLFELGAGKQHVRMQVYLHRLDSSAAVVEWTRGTFLKRWERVLPPEMFDRFVARYREHLLEQIGDREPYPFTFNRILAWARFR